MSPANQTRPYRDTRPGKPATRDSVAEDLVRSWSLERRARVRARMLEEARQIGAEDLAVTQMQLVALIDKVSEEEKVA